MEPKQTAVDAYNLFLEKEEIKWKPPKYTRLETIPFIPSETELNQNLVWFSEKSIEIRRV